MNLIEPIFVTFDTKTIWVSVMEIKRDFKTYNEVLRREEEFKRENLGLYELTFKQFSKIFLKDSKKKN